MLYTALLKNAHCKRGEYCEEIDVDARTGAEARRKAQAEINKFYNVGMFNRQDGVRIARIIRADVVQVQ